MANINKKLKRLIVDVVRERFENGVPSGLKVDVVNLDRGGEGGLVYLDGALVIRGKELLDGCHRMEAVRQSGKAVEMRVVQVEGHPDPIPGAIYVPAGPTPDYVVDRATHTILIGWGRGEREATRDETRAATMAAIADLFGN